MLQDPCLKPKAIMPLIIYKCNFFILSFIPIYFHSKYTEKVKQKSNTKVKNNFVQDFTVTLTYFKLTFLFFIFKIYFVIKTVQQHKKHILYQCN